MKFILLLTFATLIPVLCHSICVQSQETESKAKGQSEFARAFVYQKPAPYCQKTQDGYRVILGFTSDPDPKAPFCMLYNKTLAGKVGLNESRYWEQVRVSNAVLLSSISAWRENGAEEAEKVSLNGSAEILSRFTKVQQELINNAFLYTIADNAGLATALRCAGENVDESQFEKWNQIEREILNEALQELQEDWLECRQELMEILPQSVADFLKKEDLLTGNLFFAELSIHSVDQRRLVYRRPNANNREYALKILERDGVEFCYFHNGLQKQAHEIPFNVLNSLGFVMRQSWREQEEKGSNPLELTQSQLDIVKELADAESRETQEQSQKIVEMQLEGYEEAKLDKMRKEWNEDFETRYTKKYLDVLVPAQLGLYVDILKQQRRLSDGVFSLILVDGSDIRDEDLEVLVVKLLKAFHSRIEEKQHSVDKKITSRARKHFGRQVDLEFLDPEKHRFYTVSPTILKARLTHIGGLEYDKTWLK